MLYKIHWFHIQSMNLSIEDLGQKEQCFRMLIEHNGTGMCACIHGNDDAGCTDRVSSQKYNELCF